MKTNLSAIALGLALAYAAAPVMAATTATIDQLSGNSNNAYIEQSGTDSTTTAKVTQTGSGNMAGDAIGLNDGTVDRFKGGVIQSTGLHNEAEVTQNGDNGLALVRQENGASNGVVKINQGLGADHNNAYVRQDGVSTSHATINQNAVTTVGAGDNNSSYISQYGTASIGLNATITQTGLSNDTGVADDPLLWPPEGINVGAAIVQTGNDHGAIIVQNGNNNIASILQSGSFNNAYITQESNDNLARITQSGSGADTLANNAYVYQAASFAGTTAFITQSGGYGNSAGINQH